MSVQRVEVSLGLGDCAKARDENRNSQTEAFSDAGIMSVESWNLTKKDAILDHEPR